MATERTKQDSYNAMSPSVAAVWAQVSRAPKLETKDVMWALLRLSDRDTTLETPAGVCLRMTFMRKRQCRRYYLMYNSYGVIRVHGNF